MRRLEPTDYFILGIVATMVLSGTHGIFEKHDWDRHAVQMVEQLFCERVEEEWIREEHERQQAELKKTCGGVLL